jgi:molybdate transport repressor ModE-like protein
VARPKIQRYLRHGVLPQLRLFEASARLGSFTRAAQEVGMSQPAASAQIRKLSETVGAPLFEQVGKRIHVTDAGRRLYQTCEEIFAAFTSLEEALAGMRTLDAGRLRLAVSTSGISFAPRLVGAFVQRHPGIQTSLQPHNRQSLVRRLINDEDDLYLFPDPPDMEEAVAQELLPNPLVVLARDDHPLARERNIAFERLAREPFLIREDGSGTRRTTLRLFRERGLTPQVRMELGTNEAIKEAILSGLGVSIMSRYTFGQDPESARYVCLDVEGFPIANHWYFAYPVGKQLSPVARAFLDFARAEAKWLVSAAADAPAET